MGIIDDIVVPIFLNMGASYLYEKVKRPVLDTAYKHALRRWSVNNSIREELYQPLNSLCLNGGYHSSQLLIDYLLAWKWWTKVIVEWHSFGKSNHAFYGKIACEMGGYPAVLYSVVRVLNTIGSQFAGEGINWIYEIVKGNRQLPEAEYESDTLFYLEQFMRKYVFRNKEMIRKDLVRKNRVITILDFMVEMGSVQGYLLRENIL